MLSKKNGRRPTREVMVGAIGVGGSNPVRIQSMTTSSTRDVDATAEQIMRLADAGCEIARVTVQGIKEADACEQIKNTLIRKGYTIPLVADIHFFPPAAMRVVDFVEKVRINPGNYADKRASFKVIEYDDAAYAEELLKIEEKFVPLVEKCKKLKRAMRIGTNHGSLSDRIMNRYGDTPNGMLESALEFARICRAHDYHDFVFSMKSSNPQVMIHAYRLLAARMDELDWDYPLHLGVTEAGQGEDGRIKSAMGIGTLLLEGIGDTIRVSLTEDAWNEIDPCKRLIAFAKDHVVNDKSIPWRPCDPSKLLIPRRQLAMPKNAGLHRDGSVIVGLTSEELASKNLYDAVGCGVNEGKPKLKALSADSIALKSMPRDKESKEVIEALFQAGIGLFTTAPTHERLPGMVGVVTLNQALELTKGQKQLQRFTLLLDGQQRPVHAVRIADETEGEWERLKDIAPEVIVLSPQKGRLAYSKAFFAWLRKSGLKAPVILNFSYDCSEEDLVIHASAEAGALLCDGEGEGLWLEGPYAPTVLRQLSFGLLQAARMRMSKTDFISCPSCGRTLFDLQDVTKRIKSRTAHLPGVKIAIMGCIVNGPGEMADADFGYVGSKPGMIDLYVGKTCVEKDIDFGEADDRLIELIKRHGRWIEPVPQEAIML